MATATRESVSFPKTAIHSVFALFALITRLPRSGRCHSEAADRVALNELKTLSKENAEGVAKHLVMAARLIEEDPQLAHNHAISAARRAGRIGVVRETLAITAYAIEDYALALRELRTYRRITGRDDQLPMMVDSERGLGRPEKALELGRSVSRSIVGRSRAGRARDRHVWRPSRSQRPKCCARRAARFRSWIRRRRSRSAQGCSMPTRQCSRSLGAPTRPRSGIARAERAAIALEEADGDDDMIEVIEEEIEETPGDATVNEPVQTDDDHVDD